ncbi:MAG: tRNA lysidine(34) synthetase TilS [Timaviella obliquedivisa GSE-PSE-MK23-08B]|jgi:tRNA(Ile)-lysidine synthase|nr:tRNA lysidine(34) synthetase TilS [Timaviella obliquedivisa GSE-PSE-MK23-08B]
MADAGWTLHHARLHRVLRALRDTRKGSRQLLLKNERLLVAVSGGQDSLCLMQLLLDLQPKWSWELAIAHCNHRWRADAADNALYVEEIARAWQVPYFCKTAVEIPTSEATARAWRYEALAEIAIAEGYGVVVTGHTQSDRAETTLYNLLRGSGADGLQALSWQRELGSGIRLVRPLLEMTRTETAECCQLFHLKVWEDSTNQDLHYARNRIRQELIPYLQTYFNPQVEQALAQTADLLTADVDYLNQTALELLQKAHSELGLNRVMLQSIPLALQRRVIRQFLQKILPIAPSFDQVEKLVGLIGAPNRSQCDPLPGEAIAQVEGDWIQVKPQNSKD